MRCIWIKTELQGMLKVICALDGNHSCSSRSQQSECKSWWWTLKFPPSWRPPECTEELSWTGSLIWRYSEQRGKKNHEFIRNVLCFFLPGFELLSCECESVLNYLVFLAHLLANSLNSRPNWKFWRWVLHPERPPVSTATHLFPKLWPRPTWSLLHPSTKRLAPEAWTQGNNSRKGWIQNTTQPFFLRLLLLHPSTSSSVWVCWAASCGS